MNRLMSVVSIVVLVASVNAQSGCTTPVGEQGTCVPAKECSIIVNILTYTPKPMPQKALDYLKSSHCGVQDNVHYACCSSRHTTTSNATQKPPVSAIYKENTKNNQEQLQKDETSRGQNMNAEVKNADDHPNLKLLPLTQCGRNYENYIYSDTPAIGEFPWNVLLQYQTRQGLKFQCGGALISSRYVLTAAHCVTGTDDILVAVRVGEYDISSEIDCEKFGTEEDCADPPQDIEIEEVIFHPEYDSRSFSNDVALIRLKKEVNISSETVHAVCLPITEESQRQVLTKVIISGWGTTETNEPSGILRKATVPVVSNSQCQMVFGRCLNITNAQTCAGGENMIDIYKGDSGGPLIFPGKVIANRYIQYGVISPGANACRRTNKFPGIYTKVSFYIKWILDQLKP